MVSHSSIDIAREKLRLDILPLPTKNAFESCTRLPFFSKTVRYQARVTNQIWDWASFVRFKRSVLDSRGLVTDD
jgi:hypothetical protein